MIDFEQLTDVGGNEDWPAVSSDRSWRRGRTSSGLKGPCDASWRSPRTTSWKKRVGESEPSSRRMRAPVRSSTPVKGKYTMTLSSFSSLRQSAAARCCEAGMMYPGWRRACPNRRRAGVRTPGHDWSSTVCSRTRAPRCHRLYPMRRRPHRRPAFAPTRPADRSRRW